MNALRYFLRGTTLLLAGLSFAFLLGASAVHAQALCTWAASDGAWEVAANWSCAHVPTPTDSVLIDNGTVVTLASGTLDGTADVTVTDVISWTGGTLAGTGALVIPPGLTLTLQVGTTLDRTLRNSGTVYLREQGSYFGDGVLANQDGALFHATPTGVIFAGRYFYPDITNAAGGTVRASSLPNGINFFGDLLNDGNIEVDNQAGFYMQPGTTLTNNGQIGIRTTPAFGVSMVVAGGENNGTILVEEQTALSFSGGAHTLRAGSSLTGEGTLNVYQPSTLTVEAGATAAIATVYISNSAPVALAAGSLLRADSSFTNHYGIVLGEGTLDVTTANAVVNHGTFAPGNSPGLLAVEGAFGMTSNAYLDVELGGLVAVEEHDVLAVAGAATLGGTLRLLLVDGFAPAVDDAFEFLTATDVVGTFAVMQAPAGYAFDLRYEQTSVTATVTAIPVANEPGTALPEAFALHLAYPNPFNPHAVIPYELPQGGHVRLAVYDLLGREVAVLVDAELPAGRHEAVFEAHGLASGIYLVRMAASDFVQTRRVTLLR